MTEDVLQQKCWIWANNTYLGKCYIFAVPNGGERKDKTRMLMAATGTRAGVADLILLLPGGKTVFIELKTPTGIQSKDQAAFEGTVNKLGFEYYICRTFEEFKELITKLIP